MEITRKNSKTSGTKKHEEKKTDEKPVIKKTVNEKEDKIHTISSHC